MKTGRNSPCPCGSGKKYKKCCAKNVASATPKHENKPMAIKESLSSAENYYRSGNHRKAVDICNNILSLNSKNFEAISLLARIAFKNGNNEKAYKLFSVAANISPNNARIQYMCGRVISETGQFLRAIKYIESAIKLNPELSEAYNFLGTLYHVMGRTDEVASYALKAIQLDPNNFNLHSHQLVTSHCSSKFTEEEIFGFHKAWAKQHTKYIDICKSYSNSILPERRIKIGYVSPSFNRKIVGYFLKPIFEHHDRKKFEIYCYSNTALIDDYTDYFRTCSNWRDIVNKNDSQITDKIASDNIDILIDLSGHVPNNRLLVFARKPSPIQISWLDYFYSTGLDTMDYLISDPVSTPIGTKQCFTEKILRMPNTRLCWSPPEFMPALSDSQINSKNFLTFGSFNRPEKITPEVIKVWSDILNQTSNTKLLLKNHAFKYVDTKQYFINCFKSHGVDCDRIEFRRDSSYENLLKEYNDIDIALDTFPFNGGATTCDSLYMSTPIIALMGDRMISRQTASILTSVGLDDFIAESKDGYVKIAVSWSKKMNELSALKGNVREIFLASPVCDAINFTLDLEKIYYEVWNDWCDKHKI